MTYLVLHPAGSATAPEALFGHISGTSAASSMNKVETVRDTGTFSDIVRGSDGLG